LVGARRVGRAEQAERRADPGRLVEHLDAAGGDVWEGREKS
jgi:hypothetical protein